MSTASTTRPANVLTVEASLFSARRLGGLAAAAASLPQALQPAADGQRPADIRVIDGAEPSWPRTLGEALDTAARGILLYAPTVVSVTEARALAVRAEGADCPVVVALPFLYDLVVRDGLTRIREDLETLSLIDSIVTVGAGDHPPPSHPPPRSLLGGAFLAQLAAIQMVFGSVPDLTMNLQTDHAYSSTGTQDGTTLMLAGLVSSLPATLLRVDLIGPHRRHTIGLADPAPATILSYGAPGMFRLAPSYTSGLRNAWRNLHEAVTGAEPVRFGLRELAAVLPPASPWSR